MRKTHSWPRTSPFPRFSRVAVLWSRRCTMPERRWFPGASTIEAGRWPTAILMPEAITTILPVRITTKAPTPTRNSSNSSSIKLSNAMRSYDLPTIKSATFPPNERTRPESICRCQWACSSRLRCPSHFTANILLTDRWVKKGIFSLLAFNFDTFKPFR